MRFYFSLQTDTLELKGVKPDEPGLALEASFPTFLIGYDLSVLRKVCPLKKFSNGTSTRLAMQCFDALEAMHNKDLLHRDVKPSNFAMGAISPNNRVVYILDFGLVRCFKTKSGKIRPARKKVAFRDVEFLVGQLPWQDEPEKVLNLSMKITSKGDLFRNVSPQLLNIYNSLLATTYHETPTYAAYRRSMNEILTSLPYGGKFSDPFDFEEKGQFYERAFKDFYVMQNRKKAATMLETLELKQDDGVNPFF
uniref:Protein kinase domain-containing protein n=1 Tax=Romanomermis culicivorax TaxID=13658 RepID=A0A915KG70_ROMCU